MLRSVVLFLLFIYSSSALSDEIIFADSHGPISVIGDHLHKKNEFMFSYRLSKMKMGGMLQGQNKISIDSVMSAPNGASDSSGRYMNSPTLMNMNMHMFGGMYAPTDNLTFMLMTGYLEKEMTSERMRMSGGTRFNVNSNGISDTRLSALIRLYKSDFLKSHIGLGVSFPTGGINKRDSTPMSSSARLGYGMQNGTGTFDPYFLINNVNNFDKVKVGEQFIIKKPVSGDNRNGYHYGTTIDTTIWSSYRWLENVSTAIKFNYKYLGQINGSDDEMNKRMNPSMDSNNVGHQKINLGFGINYINNKDFLRNHRLGLEIILPIYQKVRGIQMSETYKIMIGWQFGFEPI